MLKAALPPAMADGQVAARPTLLPLPGELPPQEPAAIRVSRLARFGGATLFARTIQRIEAGDSQPPNPSETEARLFFNYLRGEFVAAAADLEALEAAFRLSPRSPLLSLLSAARSSGHAASDPKHWPSSPTCSRAESPNRQLVEETPFGLVFSPYVSPTQAWARYLSARAR